MNEPLVIDFKLVVEDGKRKLLNLSQPECQIKKVKWDFDSDGIHESEDRSPEIPENLTLEKVTLMINGLNEVTKTLSDVAVPLELVVDLLAPNSAKVGEEIVLSSLSAPLDLVKDINWSFGDDMSNTENKSEVYHAYAAPGTYTIELCINYDFCKNHEIKITGKPKKIVEVERVVKPNYAPQEATREIYSNATSTSTSVKNNQENTGTANKDPSFTTDYNSQTTPNSNIPITTTSKSTSTVPAIAQPEPPPPPVYSIRINMPVTAEVGQNIMIADNSTVTNGRIETYNWLIDGNSKFGKRVNYSFNTPGDFEVQLCLNGSTNCTKRTIRVKEKKILPIYQIDFSSPSSVTEGDRIELSSNSTANVDIKTYSWTIEGQSKSGRNVFHVFTKTGPQKIKLCLDNRDCKTKIINVEEKEKIVVSNPAPEGRKIEVEENKIPTTEKKNPDETVNGIPEKLVTAISSTEKTASVENEKPILSEKAMPPSPAPTTSASANKVSGKKESSTTFVIPKDDDFYAKNTASPRPAFSDCSEGGWISGSTIRFTPKQKMTLHKAVVYANGNGKIEFKLGYNHNGLVEEIPVTRNVNAGRSELLLSKFYMTLYPGITYTLVLSTKTDGLKIRNAKPCGLVDQGDGKLGIEHKSGYCLFELQYKY